MAFADNASTAYGTPQDAVLSHRQVEYKLFAQVTHRLSAAAARADETPAGFARLADALHENHRLWIALASDLASDGNRLPETLRAGMLSLANFVFSHSPKVLSREAAADALIDINASIMKGLRGSVEIPDAAGPPAPVVALEARG